MFFSFFFPISQKVVGRKNTFDSFLLFTTVVLSRSGTPHTHNRGESVLTVTMIGKHLWHLVGGGQGRQNSYNVWDSLTQHTVPSPAQLSNVPINIHVKKFIIS